MKTLLNITALLFLFVIQSASAAGLRFYDDGIAFPDQGTPDDLPLAFPCGYAEYYYGKGLDCTWIEGAQNPAEQMMENETGAYGGIFTDPTTGERFRGPTMYKGVCRRGVCRSEEGVLGEWSVENMTLIISPWYVLRTSIDGKPIAVRRDAVQDFSYSQAGVQLVSFYYNIGVPDYVIAKEMKRLYIGGWEQYGKDIEKECASGNPELSCGE